MGNFTQMPIRRVAIFRWFLEVNYVSELTSLLAAIRAKLIAPHTTVASRTVNRPSLMNRILGMALLLTLTTNFFTRIFFCRNWGGDLVVIENNHYNESS